MHETGDGPDAFPDTGRNLLLEGNQAHPLLERLSEGYVTGAEAFIGHVGEEHGPLLLRSLVDGPQSFSDLRSLSGDALCQVLEKVGNLVLVAAVSAALDDSLQVDESVLPYRVLRDGSRMVPRVEGSHGRVLADTPEDPPVDEPPSDGTVLPVMCSDTYGFLQEEDQMRSRPAAAGGLFADEFAKVSEDASHSSFEVVYDACDGIASGYLARPEGGPCPLTAHDSRVEREGDEEQLGHAVVAGSRDGPVEHPRFQGFGEGVALFALLRTEYDVATLGAECMNPLACLRIHELVEVLRLLPIECHHLQMIVSESESPLDEITHQLHGFEGPITAELGAVTTTRKGFRRRAGRGLRSGTSQILPRIFNRPLAG